jgi:phosphonates import ATP-binding protein phnC
MEIKFNNFSGKYNKSSLTVLKDISFTINSGEMIAIIGKSGSGKTSLFNAILKQLYIAQGEIIINNYSLDNIKKRE